MYEAFFGFRERPFDLTPDPRYLVLTESHREALNNLEYGIASRKGITLLVGEAGSGKTTVIRAAMERQPARVHAVHLHNPTLTRAEFSEMLALKFELSPEASRSKTAMLIELERLLKTRVKAGESTVLIVDEAQSLPLDLLEEIRLLANVETNDQKLLPVIIAGQPEIVPRLNDPSLRQFKQRIGLRCELRALTSEETKTYVQGRIHAAGGRSREAFTLEAVELIYNRAKGLPRLINVIADNALVGGFANKTRPVTTDIVRDVCRDFDLSTPRGSVAPAVSGRGRLSAFQSTDRASIATDLPGPLTVATDIAPEVPAIETARIEATDRAAPVEPVEVRRVGEDAAEMFSAFSTKRRRFSLFGK